MSSLEQECCLAVGVVSDVTSCQESQVKAWKTSIQICHNDDLVTSGRGSFSSFQPYRSRSVMVALVMSSYSGSRKRRRFSSSSSGRPRSPSASPGEAEASSVPTGGLTLPYAWDPGETVTLVKSVKNWKAVGYSWEQISLLSGPVSILSSKSRRT